MNSKGFRIVLIDNVVKYSYCQQISKNKKNLSKFVHGLYICKVYFHFLKLSQHLISMYLYIF